MALILAEKTTMMRCLTTNRIRRIRDDDVKLGLMMLHKLKTVANVNSQLRTFKSFRHERQKLLCNLNNFLSQNNGKLECEQSLF